MMTDYTDLTAAQFAAMPRAMRADYYAALYQQAGTVAVMFITAHAFDPPPFDAKPGEQMAYSAAGNALAGLLDALVALGDIVEVPV